MKRKTKISNKNILTNVVKVVVNDRKRRKGKNKSKSKVKPQEIQQATRPNISNMETTLYTDKIKELQKVYELPKEIFSNWRRNEFKANDFKGYCRNR